MARKPKKQLVENDGEVPALALGKFLSQKAVFARAVFWIVGHSPLIVHSWSEKAKLEMLRKHTKAMRGGKEMRNPEKEFQDSLYRVETEDGETIFGFPATAIKKCLLSAAHKDKNIPRDTVMRSLWIHAPFVRVHTAFSEARCEMPIVRLWGSAPEMREDMVRIGAGMSKTAGLAYRAQFRTWAIRIVARYNASVINKDLIAWLTTDGGMSCGIGDWRNEKSGMFGAFHLANADEERAWDAFGRGKGKLPAPSVPKFGGDDDDDFPEFQIAAE